MKPTPGSQLALFDNYSYHAFITDRDGETLELEADHRRHAEIENAIRDLKYGVGLNHLPSGRFPANGAWLAVQSLPRTRYGVIAHNLARWTARIGLGEQVVTTKTLRRRFFSLAGRLTRKARRLTLHLPHSWPWENQFSRALARLRALPLPSRRCLRRLTRPLDYPTASQIRVRPGPSCLLLLSALVSRPLPRRRPVNIPLAWLPRPSPSRISWDKSLTEAFPHYSSTVRSTPLHPIGGFGLRNGKIQWRIEWIQSQW